MRRPTEQRAPDRQIRRGLSPPLDPGGGQVEKGRRFPSGDEQKQYWKNWSAREDLESLAQWEALFGESFRGLFVFAYNILGDRAPLPAEQLFEHRGTLYGFVAIELAHYTAYAHPISPSWDTVAMPTADFRRLARPVDFFLTGSGQLE